MVMGAAFFWGTSATLAKFLLNQQLDTLLIVQTRTTFSALILFAFLLGWSRESLRIQRSDVWRFAILGILGVAGANFTYYFTIKESSVATAITIQYTAPLFVMAYEVITREERFTVAKLAAALLAFAGCFLAVNAFGQSSMHITSLGLLTGAGSIFSFALLTIMSRHLLARYSAWTVTLYGIIFAALFWLIINPPSRVIALNPSAETLGVLFVLAMCSILIPNLLYTLGLRSLVPSRAVITSTLEPVIAIVTAAIFIGEVLTFVQVISALFVVAAIILLQVSREESPNSNSGDLNASQ